MLGPDDLRTVDEYIIKYMSKGRVTPNYARKQLATDGVDEYTRGYVHQRLARLVEHDHAVNLLDSGLYELRDDPRVPPGTES